MLHLLYFILWFLYFMLGACVFSFITVVAERLPRKENITTGRSHCISCSHILSPFELIPCFSFIFLGGKCRSCKAKIPARCFIMEIIGGMAAIACGMLYGGLNFKFLLSFSVISILAIITLMDIDTMEIWNRFVLIILILGIASIWIFPRITLIDRIIGAFAISLPMFLLALFIAGGFGGGDIKLMFAAGFLLGWQLVLCAAFIAILSGGFYGIYLLAAKKAEKNDSFAFGPFLALGIACSMLWGEGIIAWYMRLL